ncbi:unnamed protein product [Trifolium pratense]|uniref:Uncharacterized protein n=1 Tax=Trifolium pratense TaxID=57577 RepID=A0ACB0KZR2_TRIPR|nr:unnamed protein product [Trifolium pratense]
MRTYCPYLIRLCVVNLLMLYHNIGVISNSRLMRLMIFFNRLMTPSTCSTNYSCSTKRYYIMSLFSHAILIYIASAFPGVADHCVDDTMVVCFGSVFMPHDPGGYPKIRTC